MGDRVENWTSYQQVHTEVRRHGGEPDHTDAAVATGLCRPENLRIDTFRFSHGAIGSSLSDVFHIRPAFAPAMAKLIDT